jgi:hypothetical protein
MSSVIDLSAKTSNGHFRSPAALCDDAKEHFQGPLDSHKKALILSVDEEDGDYSVSFQQAGMKMSECVALCEVAKTLFLKEMNYIPDD